jgi:hypothetical protein
MRLRWRIKCRVAGGRASPAFGRWTLLIARHKETCQLDESLPLFGHLRLAACMRAQQIQEGRTRLETKLSCGTGCYKLTYSKRLKGSVAY